MHLLTFSSENRIRIVGDVTLQEFRRVLAALHGVTRKQGYQDVELDFRGCGYVVPGAMAAIVAQVTKLRDDGIETAVLLPAELRPRNLFVNAGWAHYLEPARFDVSRFRGLSHVPLSQFGTSTEQGILVNRLMDTLLRSATQFVREDFAAVEWTISEITDNVLVHSESRVGGFVQLNSFLADRRVEVVVADPGLGIPRTLRGAIPSIRSDSDALEKAIREGVTRSVSIGQGNGLYGSYRIAEASGGYFHVHAGNASLEASRGHLKLQLEPIPYNGTLIVAGMDYSQPNALARALRFSDEYASPSDYIELQYEVDSHGTITMDLSEESQSFGSRDAGSPIRTKILNLVRMGRDLRTLTIDLSNVPLVSSSFADEIFGKLFLELGPMEFMRVLRIQGANMTVQELVNRAILQRSRESGAPQ